MAQDIQTVQLTRTVVDLQRHGIDPRTPVVVIEGVNEDQEPRGSVGVELATTFPDLVGFMEPSVERLQEECVVARDGVGQVGDVLDDLREVCDLVRGRRGGGFEVCEPDAQGVAVETALAVLFVVHEGLVGLRDRVVFLAKLGFTLALPFVVLL